MFQNCIEYPAQNETNRKAIEEIIIETYKDLEDRPAKDAFDTTVQYLLCLKNAGNLPCPFTPTNARVRSILLKHKVYRSYSKISSGKPTVHFLKIMDTIKYIVGEQVFCMLGKNICCMSYIKQLKFWTDFLTLQDSKDEAEALKKIMDYLEKDSYIIRR